MSLPKTLRRHRGWIATITLFTVVVAAYLMYQQSGTSGVVTTYTTEQAVLGMISVTVSGTGNLAVDDTTDVHPSVSGTVVSVAVSEGSMVTTGTTLFTLDSSAAEAATTRALASYRQAQQQVAQARVQVTKAEDALSTLNARADEPTTTVTTADIDVAIAEVASAKAALAAAQASAATAALDYEDAQDAEDDLTVTAPCSGVVWALDVEASDFVTPSSGSASASSGATGASATDAVSTGTSGSNIPVVIAPEQPLAIHLTVNEIDVPMLAVGQRADIEFDAFSDLAATGKVYDISAEGTNSQGVVTFDVWISLDVASDALRPGMSAAATIVTEVASNALIVPNAAVKADSDGGYYVEVLNDPAGTPRRVTVETGLVSATRTQILSGLADGDSVVTQTLDDSESDSSGQNAPGGMMMPGMGGGPRG